MKRFSIIIIRSIIATLLSASIVGCTQLVETPPDVVNGGPIVIRSSSEAGYFKEIAFGSEFGDENEQRIHKWNQVVKVRVFGEPTEKDRAHLAAYVAHLNTLVDSEISIQIVTDNSYNVAMHFTPKSNFQSVIPTIRTNVNGYVSVKSRGNVIFSGTIVVDTGLSDSHRAHVILEEFTQSLGLLNDSYMYKDSIFYQGYNNVNALSVLDEDVVALLYTPGIKSGMTLEEFNRKAVIL
jgi:hypothetical protein